MTDVQSPATEGTHDGAFAFPLSFAQQRLWFLNRLEPGSSAYNVPLVIRLRGPLDEAALSRAFDGLVERHESLRTTFRDEAGEPEQIVRPAAHSLDVRDLTELPEATRPAEAERVALELSNAPFDLDGEPLLRTTLIRVAQNEHLLVIALHHIVADAWSLGILRRDLAELYRAELEDREPVLPQLDLQYGDFAVWQRQWSETEQLSRQLDYWREQLTGAPTLLELPSDRPRPVVQTDRGGHCRTRFSSSIAERLAALAREENATLFMVLLAAFGTLLSRSSGQRDLVVGTPIANRTRTELENLIGFFANTLALRLDVSGNPTFRELLVRVRETVLDAYGNQDVPFEQLVSEINPERSLSHTPLFQVLFQLQTPMSHGDTALAGLTAENVEQERGRAKFDLGLFMSSSSEGLRASFEYSSDLFDRETVERMLGHLGSLLETFSADPDQPVETAPLLTKKERDTFRDWNATSVSVREAGLCVHELVEAQAAQSPGHPAATFDGTTLTYAELNERANRLAWHLRGLGVGADVCVAISLLRSVDLLVAVLAVLKAGGAYCPLDPSYPADRLRLMLDDSGARVVLTHASLVGRLPPECAAHVVYLDRLADVTLAESPENPPVLSTPDTLAYVLFTSGSTGRPKGVAMPHGTLTNLLCWQRGELGTHPARTLQFASLSFDVAFQELFSTWCVGGTLVLVDEERRRDSEALLRLIDEERVERLFVPFVALQHLAEAAVHVGLFPTHLREVLTAGEALQATPALREFFSRCSGCVLHNQYGPTESHVVTAHTLRDDPRDWPARPPIGKPIANAQIYLLDEHQRQVPIGVPGELYIGGSVLARGYLNRPELTDERFLPDPFSAGARMYRTGDRARYLRDGEIEFLGRADDQVKVRGYRVEPGEVEAVLVEHEQLRDAVVVARTDGTDDRRLVAYTVADDGVAPTTAELRDFLGARLPDFMIPSAFVALDALPLGATGKVDRRALPAPDRRDVETSEVVPPRDELERRLTEIWQRSLGIDDVISIRDDFFALGGHSLLAVRVIAMIEEATAVKLPLTSLFEASTVEEMAARIREHAERGEDWPALVRLRGGGERPPLFLLHGKDGELLHYRELVLSFDPAQPVYGIQPIGLDGRGEPSLSVEEMARHYVEEVCAFQPHGPYLLAGYCFSGVLAYEVAHQLSARGRPPAFVGLIDAGPYGLNRQTRIELERKKLQDFRQRSLRGKAQWVMRRLRGVVPKLRTKVRSVLYEAFARSGRRLPAALRDVENAIEKALSAYTSPESQISVTLFRAAQDATGAVSRPSHWKRLVKDIQIRPIVADGIRHDNIMREPHARALAAEMDACIARALALDAASHDASLTRAEA